MPTDVALDGEESLQHLTVPEIKDILRTNGHKVRAYARTFDNDEDFLFVDNLFFVVILLLTTYPRWTGDGQQN